MSQPARREILALARFGDVTDSQGITTKARQELIFTTGRLLNRQYADQGYLLVGGVPFPSDEDLIQMEIVRTRKNLRDWIALRRDSSLWKIVRFETEDARRDRGAALTLTRVPIPGDRYPFGEFTWP